MVKTKLKHLRFPPITAQLGIVSDCCRTRLARAPRGHTDAIVSHGLAPNVPEIHVRKVRLFGSCGSTARLLMVRRERGDKDAQRRAQRCAVYERAEGIQAKGDIAPHLIERMRAGSDRPRYLSIFYESLLSVRCSPVSRLTPIIGFRAKFYRPRLASIQPASAAGRCFL